jgi:hypothetical protein
MKSAGKVLSVLSLYTAGRPVWSPERAARKRTRDVAVSRLALAVGKAAREIERMRDGGSAPTPGARRSIGSGAKA